MLYGLHSPLALGAAPLGLGDCIIRTALTAMLYLLHIKSHKLKGILWAHTGATGCVALSFFLWALNSYVSVEYTGVILWLY